MQLPEDIKALTECPFPVTWRAVVSVVDFGKYTDGKGLKSTLKRKELARHLVLVDIVQRLDPASALGQEARPVFEAHLATGAPLDACT